MTRQSSLPPRITLPLKFELCINGKVKDLPITGQVEGITYYENTWGACKIIKELISNAEKSSHQPKFERFEQRPVTSLSEAYLEETKKSSTSKQKYGRTVVYDSSTAVKMQKKAIAFRFHLTPQEPSELLQNTFYLTTNQCPNGSEGVVDIKYTVKTESGVQKDGGMSFMSHLIFPLPAPLTQEALNANFEKIKSVVLTEAVKKKHIPDSHDVTEESQCLAGEISMQSTLRELQQLQSDIPNPIGIGFDAQENRHYCVFTVPTGYYAYLSDIQDGNTFMRSACRAAHDLGFLLKKGYVFQNLISVFHGEGRSYTLLPSATLVERVHFGGLPGRVDGAVYQALYENMGQSGLRDLGDLQFIEDFNFDPGDSYTKNASNPLKIAHFVSLYLMVFTILIGNHSRKLEQVQPDENHWNNNHVVYSSILNALFLGFGITLSSSELFYIDLAQTKPQKNSSGAQRLMQPSEKFNQQLRVWFTNKTCINDKIASKDTEEELQNVVYGSKKVSYARVSQPSVGWEHYLSHGSGVGHTAREQLWQNHLGALGQYPSGINPLTTVSKYALRAAQLAVGKLYGLVYSNTTDVQSASSETSVIATSGFFGSPSSHQQETTGVSEPVISATY